MSSISLVAPSSNGGSHSKKRSSTSSTPPPKRNRMESCDEHDDDDLGSESEYSTSGKQLSDYDTAQSLVQFSSSSSSNTTASSTPSTESLTVHRPSVSSSPPSSLSQTERRRYLHRLYDRQRRARAAAAEESLKKMLFGGDASTIKKVDVLEKAVWALKSMQTKLKELNCNDTIINTPTAAWLSSAPQSSASLASHSSPSLNASIPLHPPSQHSPLPPQKEPNARSPQPSPYRASESQAGMQSGYYLSHPSDVHPMDPSNAMALSMMVYPHFVQPRYSFSFPPHPPIPINGYKYRSASVVQ